jgi:hypothetical protein
VEERLILKNEPMSNRRRGLHDTPTETRSMTGLRKALGVTSAIGIGVALLANMVANDPDAGLRNGYVFGVIVVLLGANAAVSPSLARWAKPDPFRFLTLIFLTIGVLSLAGSLLDLYPSFPLLPRRSDYVLRQAYFIVLWLPCLIGALQVWSATLPFLVNWFSRYGLCMIATLGAADIGSAMIFADPATAWDGYLSFLEKSSLEFFSSVIFLFTVMFNKRRMAALMIITAYLFASQIVRAGSMFNVSNGLIIFAILVVMALPFNQLRTRLVLAGSIYLAMTAGMLAGLVTPQIYSVSGDSSAWAARREADAAWRAQAWRNNLTALAESDFIGVGFGVPYHPLTLENVLDVEEHGYLPEEGLSPPPGDFLYVRGQHSSIINIFYRLGLVGGVVFLSFNLVLFNRVLRSATIGDVTTARLSSAAGGLFVIALTQISVNVGLESPGVFLIYICSVSFGLHCLDIARVRGMSRSTRLRNEVELHRTLKEAAEATGLIRPRI